MRDNFHADLAETILKREKELVKNYAILPILHVYQIM